MNVIWDASKYAQRVKKCPFILDASNIFWFILEALKIQWGLTKPIAKNTTNILQIYHKYTTKVLQNVILYHKNVILYHKNVILYHKRRSLLQNVIFYHIVWYFS